MQKALVFIHGLGLGEWIFHEHFVPYFRAQGFDIHTLNLPGHSSSSSALERQKVTLDLCVTFVEAYLLNHLTGPYAIVGMSMGGAICQKLLEKGFAHTHLRGMVLLSSVPPTNNLLFTLRLCKKLAVENPQALIDFFSGKVNPPLLFSSTTIASFSNEKIETYINKTLHGFPRLEYEIFFQNLISHPFTPKIPLKIIGGADDLLFSSDVTEFTAAYYSQAAEILPDIGHMIPVEAHYSRGIEAIDSFLREIF